MENSTFYGTIFLQKKTAAKDIPFQQFFSISFLPFISFLRTF